MVDRISGGRVPGWFFGLGVFAAGYFGWENIQSGDVVYGLILWVLGVWLLWLFWRQLTRKS